MDDMGKVIREKVAGYRELEKLQDAERAKETFSDRARALTMILKQSVFKKTADPEEAVVRERWVRLKSAYERRGT